MHDQEFNSGPFFGPETLALLGRSLDAAVEEAKRLPASTGLGPHALRNIVARRLIQSAHAGERNPARLKAAALAAFGESPLTISPTLSPAPAR